MLVLNRKPGEAIIIADRTVVKVFRIAGDTVSMTVRGRGKDNPLRIDFVQSAGQSFKLDGQVNIEVANVRDGRVRFAIDAPREIRILRDELLERA